MKICCWINFEMHFKSNSDKLYEQAFPKIYFQNKYAAYLFTNTRILIQLIQNERGITKVTEVSVFLFVEENLIEPVKGGNENQYQLCSWSPVPLGDTLQGVWVGFWGGNRDLQGCWTAKNSNALFLKFPAKMHF